MSLRSLVGNTIPDLKQRWHRAREAAFHKLIETKKSENEFLAEINSLDEEKFEELLNAIFLNSRNLGISYQKAKNIVWEQDDFAAFAKDLGSPCLRGDWEQKATAYILSRNGCSNGKLGGRRYCQYWREAIDGLVVGISEEVGFVRNSSLSVDDENCVDVFYEDEASPTDAIWNNTNKWGTLPDEIKLGLTLIEKKFSEMKVDLKFLGLSEKNLIYKLEPKENLTCGSAGNIYRRHLENLVREKFPLMKLKDASPVAVYGERA